MPKDPKRNIQSYQIKGGDLNEFEFQKGQSEMAQEPQLPFTDETDRPDPTQAKERIAEVTSKAHRKVEKPKKRRIAKAGARQSITAGKKTVRKVARKSGRKTTPRAAAKKRSSVKTKSPKRAPKR
jgi:hypothetical protein